MNKKFIKILKKKNKEKLVCLTAYSKPVAKILDNYCDIILVGDSLATALYGMKTTHKVTTTMMINHAKSVKSAVNNSLCIVDMPINSYKNIRIAKFNAKKIIKDTKCDAVKIENNGKNFQIIKELVKSNIPVMGHIGFTPQYFKKFKPRGLRKRDQSRLIDDAKKIEKAGAFGIVLECIAADTARKITDNLKILTIGIGASVNCDGQILVTDDMLGLSGFYPKFVKKYQKLDKIIENSVKKYRKEVINKKFPINKNTY